MRRLLIILLVLAVFLAWRQWQYRPIVHEPGVLVASAPVQRDLHQKNTFLFEDFTITPRAEIDIQARVLGRKTYFLGTETDLSPIDLALGWKRMSDQAIVDQISVRQGARWYITRFSSPPPIPEREIIESSANMHMIPASAAIERALKKFRRGDIIRIRGYLVDIDHASGWTWRTSMTRSDTGDGACEIVYVEDVQRLTSI